MSRPSASVGAVDAALGPRALLSRQGNDGLTTVGASSGCRARGVLSPRRRPADVVLQPASAGRLCLRCGKTLAIGLRRGADFFRGPASPDAAGGTGDEPSLQHFPFRLSVRHLTDDRLEIGRLMQANRAT